VVPTTVRDRVRQMDARIARALALIEKNPNMPPESLAAAANLSMSRLRYLFRLHTSTPLAAYMRSRRLAAAEELLRHTFFTVKEVAATSGFAGQSHFVRTFRRQFGLPPATYRQAVNSRNE